MLDEISGMLKIDLTKEPVKIVSGLSNLKAISTAKIKNIKLINIYEIDFNTYDNLKISKEKMNEETYYCSQLTLMGRARIPVMHKAPNGKFFTLKDVISAVEETEKQTREHTEWFGGIDVHHVFFDGISEEGQIYWGS